MRIIEFLYYYYIYSKYFLEDKAEIGTEPVKFDGYCVRTFEEDSNWEEFEKSNKTGAKKVPSKKK